jgi:hypothetical protein
MEPACLDNDSIHEHKYYHDFIDPAEETMEVFRTVLIISPQEEEWNMGWYDDVSDITDVDYFQQFDDDDDDNSIAEESSISLSCAILLDKEDILKSIVPLRYINRGTSAKTEGSMPVYFQANTSLSGSSCWSIISQERINETESSLAFAYLQ